MGTAACPESSMSWVSVHKVNRCCTLEGHPVSEHCDTHSLGWVLFLHVQNGGGPPPFLPYRRGGRNREEVPMDVDAAP